LNNTEQLDLLLHWARNAKRAQFGHYRMANRCRRSFVAIGVTITIMAGIGGSAFLVNLQRQFPGASPLITIGIGVMLLVAALLSAIQTLLRLDERAQKHLSSATKYSAARRLIDQSLATVRSGNVLKEQIDELRQLLDSLAAESPQIPDRLLKSIESHMPPTPFSEYSSQRGAN
jgi:hypothetical protein